VRLAGDETQHVYFDEQVELRHKIRRGRIEARGGRRLGAHWDWEAGIGSETIEPDSFATVGPEAGIDGLEKGDEVPFDSLPAGVARGLGEVKRGVLRLDLTHDSRGRARVAGSPASGMWGRVRGEAFLERDAGFRAATIDLRGYRAFLGGALAARARAGVVGSRARFYDRFLVGGLYTVRGFPNQSLSPPEGDTRFWSASLEWRAPLVGSRAAPRLAGVLFVEAADGWTEGAPSLDDAAVGAGYGLRIKVPWFGHIGLDAGIPLTPSPLDESFRLDASIGWTY
jgi:hypothetical protein